MNAKVFFTVAEDKSAIYVYCFYQPPFSDNRNLLNYHSCQCLTILTEGFDMKVGKLYDDVLKNLLLSNAKVREVYPHGQRKMHCNVFRYKQAQDNPSLLFWRPHGIKGLDGEFSGIYFLRLVEA